MTALRSASLLFAAFFGPPLTAEPAYRSGKPKYCLLVFGPDAATRVWLVADGPLLYADRNGNGDLTDKGEVKRALTWGGEGGTLFEFGNLTQFGGEKVQLSVAVGERPEARDGVSISVGGEPFQSVVDGGRPFRFADRPQHAPVVHFNGPLRTLPLEGQKLFRGKGPQDLTVRLGTPVRGADAFAAVFTGAVPADVCPVAEVAFPNRTQGGPPVRVTAALTERC
jgi:hypothetical protein